MVATTRTQTCEAFIRRIKQIPRFALLADYDGTLAPFVIDRERAQPYPEIPSLLLKLAMKGVRVVIVRGRPAGQIQELLGISSLEVWGCHGAERLLCTGEYSQLHSSHTVEVELLVEALHCEGLSALLEVKPFGVAVHWRGLRSPEIAEVECAAHRAFQSLPVPSLNPLTFDGGVEFRLSRASTADAIRQVKREMPSAPMIYMGDDTTDEDAFNALDDADLSVLVRSEYRATSAHLWLKPPEQLISLLEFFAIATGGRL